MTNPTDERAAFEAAMRDQGMDVSYWIEGKPEHGYENSRVADYWFGWQARASLAGQAAAPTGAQTEGEPQGAAVARMLTDKEIQDAVFAVLRKWNTDRAWDRYTRETGPYDVTSLRPEVIEIIRAVLRTATAPTGETNHG